MWDIFIVIHKVLFDKTITILVFNSYTYLSNSPQFHSKWDYSTVLTNVVPFLLDYIVIIAFDCHRPEHLTNDGDYDRTGRKHLDFTST